MALSASDRERIARFRESFEARYAGDERFDGSARDDRPDGSSLATRFAVGENLWIELCVRPGIPQVRAGIVTDSRWVSEDLEQVIEDSGDTMSEFVELGFEDAGLEWLDPPVEHYREGGKYFYFSTGIELERLEQLDDEAVADRIRRMLEGYYAAFRPAIEKAAADG